MTLALKKNTSHAGSESSSASPFAQAVRASKLVRWDIDKDVIRDREFDPAHMFMPEGLSRIAGMQGLTATERRFLSQIQGRTYANVFGLVERFISAKVLELSREHFLGDQTALEGLVRLADEEIKHQDLFRRVEILIAGKLPPGYAFPHDPDAVAASVLSAHTWSVMVLILNLELITQKHYKESIETNAELSPLFKDIFRFHWKEEAQHAAMDELELRRLDAALTPAERDAAVTQFIDLVLAVDWILQTQAAEDARYFTSAVSRVLSAEERARLNRDLLSSYRWTYILSGAEHPVFLNVLTGMIDENQTKRILAALSTLR
ncbi:MAG: hypothetical protein ABI036_11080 [Fibrobacteria bacterium]